MLIETIDPALKKALADRLESFELVEFLQIPIEDTIELLEDVILQNLSDVLEFAGLEDYDNETDE